MSISTLTIGGQDYISYASLAEANIYLAVDPVRMATWGGLTDDQKNSYLAAATRRLDLLTWQGAKTGGASQANKWPRTGVQYPDGTGVSTTEVPLEVGNATCVMAGSIAMDSDNAEAGSTGTNTKRVKAGSVEVLFFRPAAGVPLQDQTAYDMVLLFLEASTVNTSTGSVAYGTDGTSSFDDIDGWGLDRGFP